MRLVVIAQRYDFDRQVDTQNVLSFDVEVKLYRASASSAVPGVGCDMQP